MTRLVALFSVFALMLAASATALAAPPETHNPSGHMRGVVHAHNQAHYARPGSNNLTWHNGPVQHTSQVYAIYWSPSDISGLGGFRTGYQDTINRYFGDVAHDNALGLSTNVYYAARQYYDVPGQTNAFGVSFSPTANVINDSTPAGGSGCRDSYTPAGCVTDAQVESEISHVISANNLPTGMGTEYFVFTPINLGSCDGSQCSFSYWCAYHSNYTLNGAQVLYANMPYTTMNSSAASACGSGEAPNGAAGTGPADADSTLNVTSHEHNETITDPLGTAWWDKYGNEDGDKCAWNFGTASGTAGALYNQTINGDKYYLQQEWSNAHSGCVLQGT